MASDKMKARLDLGANSDGFTEDQLVLIFNAQRKTALSPKLQINLEGARRVIKKLNAYIIQKCSILSAEQNLQIVHLERVVRCRKVFVLDKHV